MVTLTKSDLYWQQYSAGDGGVTLDEVGGEARSIDILVELYYERNTLFYVVYLAMYKR